MQISAWLRDIGLGEYTTAFERHAIEPDILPSLTLDDLTELGVIALGHRKKLAQAIALLRDKPAEAPAAPPVRSKAGERRFAAVVFVDLTGYTRLSETLDIEDLLQLERRFMNVMEGIVQDYGGTVSDRHGDSLIAVFGYPIAHDNDALRAAAAALDMHVAMPTLTDELRADLGLTTNLKVHIGISLGEVMQAGADNTDYSVTGASLSLAKRLSDIAGPEETYVTRPIQRLLTGKAECQRVGDISLQGFAEPVAVLRLITLDLEEPGLTRTPFVNRYDEIARILARLEACRRDRQVQAITVRGEAGIGKSRLIHEVAQRARTRGFAVIRATVLDFGGARRRPLVETIAWRLLGLAGDAGTAARERVRDRFLDEMAELADDRLFLDKLLGLPLRHEDASTLEAMDSIAFRDGRQSFLVRLIAAEARKRPVLAIVEDMHRADADRLDEIAAIVSEVRDAALTLIATWRPTGSAEEQSWQQRFHGVALTVVEVEALKDEYAEEMAASIAAGTSARAAAAIRRANGNPLFLEQMILHAGEARDGGLEGSDVPDLVKSLAQARMDRLAPIDHQALQIAAILGERFDLAALRQIAEQPDYNCAVLVQERFVREEGDEFAFLHNLVREGVYRCLLRSRRRELHCKAAEWFHDRDLVLRAEHLERAEDKGAAEAFFHAAEQAAFDYDYEHALTLANRGLKSGGRGKIAFQLRFLIGELLALLGRHAASNDAYALALKGLRNARSRCAVLVNMARNSSFLDKPAQAEPVLGEAEQIAVKLDDSKLLSASYRVRGALEHSLGNAATCIRFNQLAYENAVKSDSADCISEALWGLGLAYFVRGLTRTAQQKFKECTEYCDRMGLERRAIQTKHMTAWYEFLSLRLDTACEIGRQTCVDGARIRDARTVMNGGRMQGYVLLEQGRWKEAEICLNENLRLSRQLHALRYEPVIRALLAKVTAQRASIDEAEREVEEAYELSKQLDERWVGPMILGSYATIVRDRAKQDWALAKGAEILQKGCGSHNYFLFYRDAINLCLTRGDWPAARRYADAIETYSAEEPTRWSDFQIAKARSVAAIGEGRGGDDVDRELFRIRRIAFEAGMAPEVAMLDALIPPKLPN